MLTAVTWLKDALADKDTVAHLAHYFVSAERIHASDGRLTASTPFPWTDQTFLVKGAEFEKVLTKMGEPVPELTVEEKVIRLKRGRFKGEIRTLPPEMWVMIEPPTAWEAVPAKLLPALRALRPFVSDNATKPWATGLALLGGYAYATNNIVLARSPVDWAGPPVIIPPWMVDFLLARGEGMTGWHASETIVGAAWGDGSWCHAPTITGAWPDVAALLDRLKGKAQTPVTAEWRTTCERVASLSEDVVRFYPDRITGGLGALSVEDGVETPVPAGTEFTAWDPAFLLPVLEIADRWDPTAWPQPAAFENGIVDGLVLGLREAGA